MYLDATTRELALEGCTDGNCFIRGRAGGQHTNGGCRCLVEPKLPGFTRCSEPCWSKVVAAALAHDRLRLMRENATLREEVRRGQQ